MEPDSKRFNKWVLTGDPEEDRRRKIAMLNRVDKLREAFEASQHVQIDLLAGLGGNAEPDKSKSKRTSKWRKDRETIMKALALGLHEYIPEEMARYYGYTSRPEPDSHPTNYEDDGKAPF